MLAFRPARVEDVDRLQAIEIAAAALFAGTGLIEDPPESTDARALVAGVLAGHIEVAEVDGAVVGFLLGEVLDGAWHVEEIDVLPEHARQGIGRALVRRSLERAARDGRRHATLTTFRDVPWNAPFYRSLGFDAVSPAECGPEHEARWAAQGRWLDLGKRVVMRRRVGLADLHRHLDGSLRLATLRELVGAVPPDLGFRPGMGLVAALERFALTLSGLQQPDAVRRVAAEMCEDAAADGVTTLEIRFAPQLHRGASPDAIVDAALEGAAGRAGLVLCGLYGDDPAVLADHVRVAASRPGVVGIDLAGAPQPWHHVGLADYAEPFRRAAELGIGRTVHAAEGRPPAEIRVAIEALGAQRIGHGTTLLHDPAVLDLVRERGVTIEACPTSNWHVGAIPEVAAHPLPRWLDAGVSACVCADNTLLSETTASEELRRVAAMPGMREELVQRAVDAGHRAAFRR